jgi:hypothetical protein
VFMNRRKALERPVAYQEVGRWRAARCTIWGWRLCTLSNHLDIDWFHV